MDYYESTLNDLVMFNVLDITAFCMLNKVLSAFVLPRSSITFSLVARARADPHRVEECFERSASTLPLSVHFDQIRGNFAS